MTPRRTSLSSRRFILLGTAAAIVSVTLAPRELRAGNTWDGGSALNGNWSTPQNWDADTLPDFSLGVTFAGALNLTATNDLTGLSVGGISFDATADAFTLRGNAITLTGGITDNSSTAQTINLPMTVNATQTINVAVGPLTIGPGASGSGIISGTGGITKTGAGTLTLGAANTYTGTTLVDGGTLVYGADNLALNSLVFGAAPTSTSASSNTSTLDLTNANLATTGLAVQTNSTTANIITIGSGKTLTVNGAVTVGVSEVFTNAQVAGDPAVRTVLNVTGSSWIVNGGANHFTVGVPRSNTPTNGDPAATVDLTGLANFTYNASGGELRIGGGNVAGTLRLANTSNTITAAQVRIGDSGIQQPAGGNNNGGTSSLTLGPGTNVINSNTIAIGATKSAGSITFQDAVAGSITIAGQAGGTNTANITIGSASSATGPSAVSQLQLAGHMANVQAGTVIIGRLAGSTGNMGAGNVTFDTGTFTVANLQFATNSTGSAPNGAVGTFTLGGAFPNTTSTGVLNVTSQFFLSNRTNTANLTSLATGTFVINGGTANINADIIDASTSGNPGTHTTTLTLSGGTLNLMGHAIGSSAAPITNVNLPSAGLTAILANLGGTGINGVGLTMNAGGTLILEGTNAYSGTTTISASTLQIGTGAESGTLGTDGVINDGVLIFNRTGSLVVGGAISGAGVVQQNGTGTVTLAGANTYAGTTDINAGTLAVTGSVTGSVNVNAGGALAGNGDGATTGKVGNVTTATGSSIRPGATGAAGESGNLTLASLIVNGGNFQFDLGVTSDLLNVLGTANFAGASTITPSAAAPAGTYTVLTAGTLTLGTAPIVVSPPDTRKTFTPDFTTPNTIKIIVAGNSKSLSWTGATNSTWSSGAAGPLNWNDGVIAERFFNADTVTFGDGPVNRTVNIGTTLLPAAVTVNNSAGNDYEFAGAGGIGGGATLTKSGSGKLTISVANTHAGGTTLTAGTLNLNHAAALGTGVFTISGGTIDNTSGSAITISGSNPQNWGGDFTFAGTNNLNVGSGAVTLNASPVLTVAANTLTVPGPIGGAFGLTKTGPGTLTLSGTNTLAGGVTLNAGKLNIDSGAALGVGAFTVAGGTIDNTSGQSVTVAGGVAQNWNGDFTFAGTNNLNLGSGPVTLSSDRTVTVAANTLTVGGVIGGTFNLTKSGNGTLVLSGVNTHTGKTTINAGTVVVTNATINDAPTQNGVSSLGALVGGDVSVASGATLDLSGNLTAQALNFGAKKFTIAGTGVGGAGAIINNGVSQFNALQHVALSADALVGGSQRFDIRSVPTSSLSANLDLAGHVLTKTGANQISLVGVDVTDGDIVVNQGTLSIETVTNIPDFGTGRTITYNAGTTAQFFGNTAATSTVMRRMVFNGAGIQIGSASNNNNSIIGSSMILNGNVTFAALNNTNATSTLTLTGDLIEAGIARSITKTGASRLVLAGTSGYTGTTTITNGTLQIGNGGTTGTLGGGDVVDGGILSFNRSDALTVPNLISGTGTVNQMGPGVLTLSGASTYAGTTTVSGGSLLVSGSLTGTASVDVQSGATLGGNGSISTGLNGNVNLGLGAILSPGLSSGTLTLALGTGVLDLSASSGGIGYLQFDLGTLADKVVLTSGSLNVGTNGLDLDDFSFLNAGGFGEGTYVLFDTNADIAGTLGDHVHDSVLGLDATLQFASGVNGRSDLVLVVVPEPQSGWAVLVGLGVLCSRRRKVNA